MSDQSATVQEVLSGQRTARQLARYAHDACSKAWASMTDATLRGDELSESFERGRAYAFCEVLGDQQAMERDGVFDA